MRNLLIIIVASISFYTNAQDNTFIINHQVDVMTKQHYYHPEKKLVITDQSKEVGFYIVPYLKYIDGKIILDGFLVKAFMKSDCVEKGALYILLENDLVLKFKSWNKFNCEGTYYFNVSKEEGMALADSRVRLARLVNEKDFDEFEASPIVEQKSFFVNLFHNNKIIELK